MAQTLVAFADPPADIAPPSHRADPAMADVLRMRPRVQFAVCTIYMPSGLRVKMSLADVSRILAWSSPRSPLGTERKWER